MERDGRTSPAGPANPAGRNGTDGRARPDGLEHRADALMDGLRSDLQRLAAIPSVAFPGFPPGPDAPTVLLYGHYDVQSAGDEALWLSPPFRATPVPGGGLRARGIADDKSNVIAHLGALVHHLRAQRPFGIPLTVTPGDTGPGFGARAAGAPR
ncbi:M20/M25/M40 family metallo-hydrolase [Streptomyces sp. NPDC059193]|uniref:M20/M25/M40 family metallo-hydrolase n=1 Tax=Streptomyces sp. NPDC059193 TaxID=3346763 RepID=UPI0036B4BB59